MQRRTYLAATVAGVAGVAGCTGSGGDGGQDRRTVEETPTDTPTDTPTATPEPASFEVKSVDAPERVAIGEEYQFSITVRNSGEQDGTFTDTLLAKTSDSNSYQTVGEIQLEVSAGGTVTWESNSTSTEYMTEVQFRLDSMGESWTLQVVSQTLSFGEYYTNPDGIALAVASAETRDSYTYESNGYTYEERPPSGKVYLFVSVLAENEAGQPAYAPAGYDWAAIVGNQQYESIGYYADNAYEGGELQAGIVREGYVVYEVPEDTSVQDLRMAWSEQYYDGNVAVYWEPKNA